MLATALRALWRCWPALLAWFLLGWTVRLLLVRLAGAVGNEYALAGLLILPLGIIARLCSYVAMFLVLRAELRAVTLAGEPASVGPVAFLRQLGRSSAAALLPFILIYAAWGMIQQDVTAYALASLDQVDYDSGGSARPFDVEVSVVTIGVAVLAFAIRWALGRFEDRLPAWTRAVAAYLEGAWILIAVLLVGELLAAIPAWFATRRMFAWAVDGLAELRVQFPVLDGLSEASEWGVAQFGDVVAQPLAWLAIAAIIYADAMRRIPAASIPLPRWRAARVRWTVRWRLMPRWSRVLIGSLVGRVRERWTPIASAARLVWRSGPLALGVYLLAFAVTQALLGWLTFVMWRSMGPHPLGFWQAIDDIVGLGVAVVVTVLQITVVAAAFDSALRPWTALDTVAAPPTQTCRSTSGSV